jgi:hypothetical protein
VRSDHWPVPYPDEEPQRRAKCRFDFAHGPPFGVAQGRWAKSKRERQPKGARVCATRFCGPCAVGGHEYAKSPLVIRRGTLHRESSVWSEGQCENTDCES